MTRNVEEILVCCGTSCVANGAFEVADAIEAELAKAGKHAKVRTVRTGCSGECERGPIVRLMPCDLMYYHVSVKDAPAIVT